MCYSHPMSDTDWAWLSESKNEVQSMSAEAATERFAEALAKVDDRLGVEITDRSGTRQVLITAGGEADAFRVVRRLVESAPKLSGWEFVALRPGVGFDFQVDAGGMVFEAKALSFQALGKGEAPSQLAIRLLVPNPGLEAWETMGLEVIEAGIGEELCSRIAYLEIGKREDDSEGVFALESLGGWIERNSEAVG